MIRKIAFYQRCMKHYINYKLNRPSPVHVGLRITNRCNLRCDFCYVKDNVVSEMPAKKIKNIVDQLDHAKVAYLTLTGGEPLLRKDFLSIASHISTKNIKCSLNTNGILINDENRNAIASCFDIVRFSIDGLEDVHDKTRKNEGAFKKTVSEIKRLYRIKKRRAKIMVNTVVSDDNVHQLESIYKSLAPIVDRMSFMPVTDYTERLSVYNDPRYIRFMRKGYKKLNQLPEFTVPDSRAGKRFCDAGFLYFFIQPNGSVTPCSYFNQEYSLGNLNTTTFKRILNRKNKSNNSNRCSGCYARCSTEVSMIFQQNPIQLAARLPGMLRRYKL